MLRMIQLRSSLISEIAQPELDTEYSTFGYFDGIETKRLNNCNNWKEVWQECLTEQRKSLCGKYSIFNTLCIYIDDYLHQKQQDEQKAKHDEDDKDIKFWKSEKPYLFLAMIRFQRRFKNILSQIMAIEKQIEKKYGTMIECICYFTLDSNDLILCLKSGTYRVGVTCVAELYRMIQTTAVDNNKVRKIHTIFSIQQEYLEQIGKDDDIGKRECDPLVICQMSCMIKDRERVEEFERELKIKLGDSYTRSRIMGGNDVVYRYNGIEASRLFRLYKKDGLLTHTNDLYSAAFYNINTEVTIQE